MHLGLATTNAGKRREFADLLAPLGFVLESAPADFDVEETGASFAENALLKAHALMQRTNLAAIADDSGLIVDALGGAPGLYSARYSQEPNPALRDAANRARLLRELAKTKLSLRTARFVCAIALVRPEAEPRLFEASLEGYIPEQERGAQGFGYDAVFVPEGQTQTMAQLALDVRYQISHRAKALRMLCCALASEAV